MESDDLIKIEHVANLYLRAFEEFRTALGAFGSLSLRGLAFASNPIHISAMAKSDSVPTIGPAKIGPGWSVFIAHEHQATDEIGNFTSEKSAQEWIDTKSEAWLRQRLHNRTRMVGSGD